MRVEMSGLKAKDLSQDQVRRGYHIVYRAGESNRCPGCGRSHWYIGRLSAECGFCGTALPLTDALGMGAGVFRRRGRIEHGFLSAA